MNRILERIERNGQKVTDHHDGLLYYEQATPIVVDGIKYQFPRHSFQGPIFSITVDDNLSAGFHSTEAYFWTLTTRIYINDESNEVPNPWHGLEWDPTIRF